MQIRLELVALPVSDVERAKAFYLRAGFEVVEIPTGGDRGVALLRPSSSAASIVIGLGVTSAEPGSVRGLHLVVPDVEVARAALVSLGIEVGEVFHERDGGFYLASSALEVPGPDPARRDHRTFARFSDPDGNEWILHEVRDRDVN